MYTPENIQELEPNQIFVFGSNLSGIHAGGAAKIAEEKFGAMEGVSEGMMGDCYAFPTLDREMKKLSKECLKASVIDLFAICRALPEKEFLLTKVGCGIAGFNESYMIDLFKDSPPNLIKPENW